MMKAMKAITREKKARSRTITASLLIAGTAIGAGMLGLPVATAGSGLIPSWVMYMACWISSLISGLLFLEIAMWLPPHANILSMSKTFLGDSGKILTWGLYIFLFYSLEVAYISEGGHFVVDALGGEIPYFVGLLLFVAFFCFFIYLGTRAADHCNTILMVGLIVSYIMFIAIGFSKVHIFAFNRWGWMAAIGALPVIFTSFGYQGVIPTILEYLHRDRKRTRFAIVLGSFLPFFVYIVWDLVVKGVVPLQGPEGLEATKALGHSAIAPIQKIVAESSFTTIANFFAFFALSTSFIGVTLGLVDFLKDGFRVKSNHINKIWIMLVIFIPCIIITLLDPNLFLSALKYAGGVGCVLLLNVLPIVLVWIGRPKHKNCWRVPGGNLLLIALMLFLIFELFVVVRSEFV